MWYREDRYRHLCDMHIDDWNPEFLSQFDPYDYVENLKLAKIENAMIYLQSHVGLCYYPTKVGVMHKAFVGKEDMMKKVIDLCHENDISVTGYYSLIYNTREHDRHPEWRIVDASGMSAREKRQQNDLAFASGSNGRYGTCCPNNAEYRNFVSAQIKEMAEYFGTMEGMFFDMTFWPGRCRCNSCKARWEKEVGGTLPEDFEKENYLHTQKRREWMGEFAKWVTDEAKKYMPGVSVEHNYASALQHIGSRCVDEQVNAACDYAGGDLYGSPHNESVACKMYRNISLNQPFEYMFSRCDPDLGKHTTLKTKDEMLSTVLLTQAHHGASLVIDAIDPIGTLDKRVYEQVGEVFDTARAYRSDSEGELVTDVGIYYSLKNKPLVYEPMCNFEGTVISAEGLIKNHMLYDVTGSFGTLDKYKSLIYSCASDKDDFENERFINYVKNGGSLYFSGVKNPTLLKTFFDAECVGETEERVVYIAPEERYGAAFGRFTKKYPFHFDGKAPIVEGIDSADVVATVTLPYTTQDRPKFASIHSNPPGIATEIPAMAMKCFGKGRVLWSALPIECVKDRVSKNLFYQVFTELLPIERTLTSQAPKETEILVFAEENAMQVNVVQLVTEETAKRLGNFGVTLKLQKEPTKVLSLPERKQVPFLYSDSTLRFTVSDLYRCASYEIR